MCCFVLCYFANTKIDESFRTAKIRRTFFGNSLASKFAGCVRKDDFGSGRLRKNRRRKGKTAQFRRTKGRDDPFIIRKIQSHMQFGFGTNAFFPIFGVVTTLLSVGRFCKAICNSVLEQAHFFAIFAVQSATAGCLGSTEKSGKFILAVKCISCFAVRPAPYGTGYDSYVVTARAICAYCYKGFPEPSVG